MLKESLGKDKLGRSWSVFMEIIPPCDLLPFTNVIVYICSLKAKNIDNHIGHIALAIPDAEKEIAKIDDIEIDPTYLNKGIGSLLYKYIESWALKQNIKKLHGDLSVVDSDHFNMLEHFYKKHGLTY